MSHRRRAKATKKRTAGAIRFCLVEAAESLADDLAAVGDRDKGVRFVLPHEVSKLHGLSALHDREDDRLGHVAIGAFRREGRRAAVQRVLNEVTDRRGVAADDREDTCTG